MLVDVDVDRREFDVAGGVTREASNDDLLSL